MSVKHTFLIPSGPNDGKHLHVVVAIETNGPNILLLSITSKKENIYHDPTCEVKIGDHPFIKHDSYVLYAKSSRVGKKQLKNYIENGYYVPREDISDDLFTRICDGIETSEHTPKWVIQFFRYNK